ncbi:MAG: SurA N-terminal domain-containing protein [Nanoarchaeota archaeon]|nr:SurA N-terminal domain-containing protein [Nanoarchaeota archaeon]
MTEKTTKKKLISQKVFALGFLIVVLGVIVYFGIKTMPIGNPAVAIVNGDAITARELSTRYAQLPAEYADVLSEEDFLSELIDVKLLIQEAVAQEITVSDEELDASFVLLEQQIPEDTSLDDFLQARGLTKEDLRSDLRDQLLINKLINITILSSLVIGDSEVLEFYNTHLDEFTVDEDIIPFEQIADPIRQQILFEQTNSAVTLYLAQLRSSSEIVLNGEPAVQGIAGFTQIDEELCKSDGGILLHVFTTSTCETCTWIEPALVRVSESFEGSVKMHRWQLDTGDDLATEEIESGISREALDLFKAFNNEGKVPFYLFGCTYSRKGNVYSSLAAEEQGFQRVIEELIVNNG